MSSGLFDSVAVCFAPSPELSPGADFVRADSVLVAAIAADIS